MATNLLAPESVNMLRNTGEGPYLRQRYPRVYGALGGFMGTAPDEFKGSVMDPLTAQVHQGAKIGYPLGVAAAIAPFAGGIAAVKGMVHGGRAAQRGVIRIAPVRPLTPVEQTAVGLYTDYNGLFRKNLDPDLVSELAASGNITPEVANNLPELRKALSSALDRPITKKVPLYRGADISNIGSLRPGDIIGGDRGGAGSFSSSEKVAEQFANPNAPVIFRINDPTKARGVALGASSVHSESEIALHPDTQMMVSNITKDGNKTIIDLSLFTAEDAPGFIDKGIWSATAGGSVVADQYPQVTEDG